MAQIVTITNPLTGQPAQVDQLDHTAQEIDDAIARALPGGEIDITLQQITAVTDAAEYSAEATYAIGDYCTHDGKLYRCTTAITEAEAWTEAHWTETTVGAELTAIYTVLQNKADKDRVVNPNLLDNWYFGNPVDQRQGRIVKPNTTYYSNNTLTTAAGTTSAYVTAYRYATGEASGVNYASFKLEDSDTAPTYYAAPENVVRGYTGAGYGIDRWLSHEASNTTLIYDDHITISRQHAQVIDNYANLVGKQVTISALTNLGLITATGVCTNNDVTQVHYNDGNGHNIIIYNDGSYHGFQVNNTKGGTLDLYGAKLELGSQQTLAHQDADGNWVLNELPNYADELARCQRYQVVFGSDTYSAVGVGVGRTLGESVDIFTSIPIPVALRATPNVSISGKVVGRNNGIYLNAIRAGEIMTSPGGLLVGFVVEGAISGAPYDVFLQPNNKLILDANL